MRFPLDVLSKEILILSRPLPPSLTPCVFQFLKRFLRWIKLSLSRGNDICCENLLSYCVVKQDSKSFSSPALPRPHKAESWGMQRRSLRLQSWATSGHPALCITWCVSGSPRVPVVIGNRWQRSCGRVSPNTIHVCCCLTLRQPLPSTTPQGCFCSLGCFYYEGIQNMCGRCCKTFCTLCRKCWKPHQKKKTLLLTEKTASSRMFYCRRLYVLSVFMHDLKLKKMPFKNIFMHPN